MKKMVPKLKLDSDDIERNVRRMGEKPRATVLSKLLQSDFEEVEERWRMLNIEKTKESMEKMVERMHNAMAGVEGVEGQEEGKAAN